MGPFGTFCQNNCKIVETNPNEEFEKNDDGELVGKHLNLKFEDINKIGTFLKGGLEGEGLEYGVTKDLIRPDMPTPAQTLLRDELIGKLAEKDKIAHGKERGIKRFKQITEPFAEDKTQFDKLQ